MNNIFIGLGSNLGNSKKNLEKALLSIEKEIGSIIKKSSVIISKPWGGVATNIFFNQVIKVKTKYEPLKCLEICSNIEKKFGRNREIEKKWGNRVLDIDILFFNNECISTEKLTIPHSFAHKRSFVMIPMQEIEKCFIHPVFNKSIEQLCLKFKITKDYNL